MIYPTIHLNGSAKSAVLDELIHALEALRAARDALAAAAPNPRDYYLQGQPAVTLAASEHAARYLILSNLIRDIEAIAENVSDQ